MTTARVQRRGIVAASLVAIVLALMVIPQTAGVQAAGSFEWLRTPGTPPFTVAHRGASGAAPENTIAAVRLALDGAGEFVEIDLRRSSDGIAVLMHDITVDRTTNGSGRVDELTFAQLRKLDAGSWKGRDFSGERVPSFAEFLYELAPTSKRAMIELKGSWPRAAVRALGELATESGAQSRVVFGSSNLTNLDNLISEAPAFARVVIQRELPPDPVEFAQLYDAIALVVSLDSAVKHPDAATLLHGSGLALLVYTLNTPERWLAATDLGVDGIVTDRPVALTSWLDDETAP